MPEVRQNLATKEWVIIATERARRPEEFKHAASQAPQPERHPGCPFCPGHEAQTTTQKYALGGPEGWKVRVVDNRFPALVPSCRLEGSHPEPYRCLPGEGVHEVIIDSPSHSKHPARLERGELRDLFFVYRERFRESAKDPKVALTLLFKNHGEGAGTSLAHPHSQLIGSSVVPAHIRHRMDAAKRYYEEHKTCVLCTMADIERKDGHRLLADTKHFTAFVLFAALSPFHIWVLPKRHTASFGEVSDEELGDLAAVMRALLRKLDQGLGDPDYNYILQSAPQDRGETAPYHWYLSLVVRLSKAAGFELGSGMFINTALPEESAKFLNSIEI